MSWYKPSDVGFATRTQLADLYSRLGVRSRAALAASLLGDDGASSAPAPTTPSP